MGRVTVIIYKSYLFLGFSPYNIVTREYMMTIYIILLFLNEKRFLSDTHEKVLIKETTF